MPQLTEELIRKRAEHNEGCLPDLEEIALHQQELEKIESLETCCRHLKICLLQNNIIPKMENLNKLKELEYLNLALNNISKIEGVDHCESLKKLDLTVNFVDIEDLEESIYNLKANVMLEDLYLTGNPCEDWTGFKQYVIAHLPRLKQLDGKLVLPHERILARQALPQLTEDLELAVQANLAKKAAAAGVPVSEGAYTKESRNEMYLEMAEQKEEKERNERRRQGNELKPKREVPGVYNYRGEIRQCNEGKFDFNLDDTTEPGKIIFELAVPKYLETGSLDVDVQPEYVRCVVKDKVTQLKLPAEVAPDRSKVQRSKTTGSLRIDMWMTDPTPVRGKKEPGAPELEPLEPDKEIKKPGRKELKGAVSVQGIYQDPNKKPSKDIKPKELLREVKTTRQTVDNDDDDDDEIPPLEPVRARQN